MPVRLDAHLTSCATVFGTFRRISNNAIQTWMANNGATNRRATDITIQNLMAMLGQLDVLLTLPSISGWSRMRVRLEADLTSCGP